MAAEGAGAARGAPEGAGALHVPAGLAVARELFERAGARVELAAEGTAPLRAGAPPPRARVRVRDPEVLVAVRRRDHLALAEAYLAGRVEVEGDLREVVRIADLLSTELGLLERLKLLLRLRFGDREAFDREAVAFHYDRPESFFLPWFDRWRSYSHGLYESEDEDLEVATERKLARSFEALGLEAGMDVFDMGCGWGSFLEYAGRRGVRVHGITLSERQHRFVSRLIEEQGLPCTVELVPFAAYRPGRRFHAAVFMGTFEHVPEYDRAAAFLRRHLHPGGRLWADFCAQRESFQVGGFMKRHLWPGSITYVNPYRLVRELIRAGFDLYELAEDTLSYACTVRDWGDRLEARAEELAREHGIATVRAFLLFLRGSEHFLRSDRTQAYHLVAGLGPAPLRRSQGRGQGPA